VRLEGIPRTSEGIKNPLGISGLMKSFYGRKQYSGEFDKDFYAPPELYEAMSRVCGFSDKEVAQDLPLVREDDALTFYMSVYLLVRRRSSFRSLVKNK